MNLEPARDRVLIRRDIKKKHGDIIIPERAQKVPVKAEIVKLGPDVEADWAPGLGVIVSVYAGIEVEIDGNEYNLVQEDDIIATFDVAKDKAEEGQKVIVKGGDDA